MIYREFLDMFGRRITDLEVYDEGGNKLNNEDVADDAEVTGYLVHKNYGDVTISTHLERV